MAQRRRSTGRKADQPVEPAIAAMGSRVRELRLAAKLTQEQVATRSGLSVVFVSMLERGERRPSALTLARLSRALEVPTAELLRVSSDSPYEDHYHERLVAFARAARLSRRDVDKFIRVGAALFHVAADVVPGDSAAPAMRPTATCMERGCGRPVLARGLCPSHYNRQRRRAPGQTAPEARDGRGPSG